MRFTILLLAATVSAVLLPLFIGHGLATHDTMPMITGLAFGLLAGIFFAVLLRLSTGRQRSRR